MPAEVISEPNPQALPSHLPDYLEKLSVSLEREKLDEKTYDALIKFRRAACYIAAGKIMCYIYSNRATNFFLAMIFLQENTLLKSELTFQHVKPRLLGE
jgi:xylulose-5-phosphate/fructose-6-phosphate phosphoketolase